MAELAEGQGHVGAEWLGEVVLDDDNPLTPPGSATYDTVNFSVRDPEIASVEQNEAEPLKCLVTLLAVGQTEVRAMVDARKGEEVVPLPFVAEIEAVELEPGEATSGTFTGKFRPASPPQA